MMRGFSPLLLAASTGLAVLLCLVSSLSSVPQAAAAAAAAAAAYAPAPARLRGLLEAAADPSSGSPLILPCCYDGLTARLVARAGFDATFLTGFGASASRGYPDTQLLSYGEMLEACRAVAEGLAGAASEGSGAGAGAAGGGSGPVPLPPIPCIADGDTGYGNAVNARRTVQGYARAGMGGVMIEDQVAPKRCGHVAGKAVVPFTEAVTRVRAACDARDEFEAQNGPGTGPLILARTDALGTDGFEAAIDRCLAFREVGCDMTFLEAPRTLEQMEEYCRRVDGPKLANMLEHGATPVLPPTELKKMGYTMAAYPLTLLSASIRAMRESLELLKRGEPTEAMILSFADTKDAVGFTQYSELEGRYKVQDENS